MEWFIIEALVALALAIAIVWWTMAPQRKLPPKRATELPQPLPTQLPSETPAGAAGRSDEASKVD
ncbi:MAG TPA: hypothetical protein PLW68_00990 [Casimicrobiaceae bacterium]|nr:hypothetical protein [Casimicrobiaceae bacterium]